MYTCSPLGTDKRRLAAVLYAKIRERLLQEDPPLTLFKASTGHAPRANEGTVRLQCVGHEYAILGHCVGRHARCF